MMRALEQLKLSLRKLKQAYGLTASTVTLRCLDMVRVCSKSRN